MTAALRIAALSAAAGLAAGAASADLTAAQVWADWQESVAGMGQTLSVGAEEAAGGTLTLRDVSFSAEAPDGGANGTIPEIVMTERGDGTVAIVMSSEIPLDFTSTGVDGGVVNFSLVMQQPDLDMVASGDPEAISYTYSAPQMVLRTVEVTSNDEPMDIRISMTLAAISGSSLVTGGGSDTRETEATLRVGSLEGTVVGTDPEGSGGTFDIAFRMADLVSESIGTASPLMSLTNLTEMLAAGFSSDGTLTHGPATFTVKGTGNDGAFDMAGAYDSGVYAVALGGAGLEYDYAGKGLSLKFSGEAMPLEVSVAAEEIGTRLAMPVAVSEEPQDAGFGLRLIGLTLSDQIWAMLDPMGGLPRDPATLVVDITGQANWLIDIFDPAVAQGPMDAAPGEVHSVTVNELRLDAVGAELSGTGAFTFDNNAGIPQPAGTMNLRLVGGNALIDSLVNMGMLPEDQAMGARMMLGLFARPGDGPDTLVSEITVQPDGAILANGQRIQ